MATRHPIECAMSVVPDVFVSFSLSKMPLMSAEKDEILSTLSGEVGESP